MDIRIDTATRQVLLPQGYEILATEKDNQSETLWFTMPRFYEGSDFTDHECYILYVNANGEAGRYPVFNMEVGEESLRFSWTLTNGITRYKGPISFSIYFETLMGGTVHYAWQTAIASARIRDGLDPGKDVAAEQPTLLYQYLEQMRGLRLDAIDASGTANEFAAKTLEAANRAELCSIPIHTLSRQENPVSWRPSPGIAGSSDGPGRLMIRAVFESEWDAAIPIWFGATIWPIEPTGIFPAGTYFMEFSGEKWVIQDVTEHTGTFGGEKLSTVTYAANALTGKANGEVLQLTDAVTGTRLRSVVIEGETVESGTGEKGPENPYELTGIQPPELSITGKNLIDITKYRKPGGVQPTIIKDVLTLTRIVPGANSYGLHIPVFLTPGTYYIKADSVSSDGGGAGLTVMDGNRFIFHHAFYSNPAGSFVVPNPITAIVTFYVPNLSEVGVTTTFTHIQLERGETATDYTPFIGEQVPLPLDRPLYNLPDGTADSYDVISGEIIQRIEKSFFTPTGWTRMVREHTTRFTLPINDMVREDSPYNAVSCTHLPTIEVYDQDAVGCCLHDGTLVFSLPGDVSDSYFSDFLVGLNDNGKPAGVFYPLAEIVPAQIEGFSVTIPTQNSIVTAQGVPVTVEYNRNTKAAFEEKADRKDTATVITGTRSGEIIKLDDAAAGVPLRSVVIEGKTTESGTGEKGPENPYKLDGIKPSKLLISGMNLIHPQWNPDYVELQEDGRYYFKKEPVFQEYHIPYKLPAGTYTLSCRYQREQAYHTAGVRIIKNRAASLFFMGDNSTPEAQLLTHTFHLTEPTLIGIGVYTSHPSPNAPPHTSAWMWDLGFFYGNTALPPIPYTGEEYPLSVTDSLRSLPDGTADSYHVNTGEQFTRVGSLKLTPEMPWEATVRNNTTRFVSSGNEGIAMDSACNAVRCNYLPTAEVYDTDAVGVCLHEGRIVLSLPGDWDLDALHKWLTVPPNGAVTIDYPLAEPVVLRKNGTVITLPKRETIFMAQGAPITIEYNRDTEAVLKEKPDRQEAAPMLTGTRSGELIKLVDAAEGTQLRSVVISGKTVESGTGEKGPANPYSVTGVKPEKMWMTGNNLFDDHYLNTYNNCNKLGTGIEVTIPAGRYYAEIIAWVQIYNGQTYTLSFTGDADPTTFCSIIVRGSRVDGSTQQEAIGNTGENHCSITLSGFLQPITWARLRFSRKDSPATEERTATIKDIMLTAGGEPCAYAPYAGGPHILPLTTPLYSLPDETTDTYDTETGLITRELACLTLDSSAVFSVWDKSEQDISFCLSNRPLNKMMSQVVCSHLPYDDKGERRTDFVSTGESNSLSIHLSPSRFGASAGDDDETIATKFRAWLDTEKEAGHPMVLVYQRQEPLSEPVGSTILRTVPANRCILSAGGAPVTVEYNRDTNTVIAALAARIEALEAGGGA